MGESSSPSIQPQTTLYGLSYAGGLCGDSCTKAGWDLAGASVPLLAIAAGATALYGVSRYCFAKMDVSLEGQRNEQYIHARDMRAHRQESASMTQGLSIATISSVALVMVLSVIHALPALGTLGGLMLMSMIGTGAVVLTNMVHDRLAPHDGRPMQ